MDAGDSGPLISHDSREFERRRELDPNQPGRRSFATRNLRRGYVSY